ncbi:MAG TPA: hypothetical protein VLT82_18695 [Myxococcaceae bacterium]|nr:hypothetical protein [Myxococcaceae bacterium]
MLAVWLAASVLGGCNCSGDSRSDTGTARVLATCVNDCGAVSRVTVRVSRGDGPDFPEVLTELTPSGGQWTGRISDIPVGPGRRFEARAYDAQGLQTASGVARSDIDKNATSVVSIDLVAPSGPNSAPILDGISASANPLLPGGKSTLSVAAHDPDPGDVLSFEWVSTCGSFASPHQATTSWTAPQAEGRCTVSVTVSDGRGGTVVAALTLTVSSSGSTTVDTQFNGPPRILGLSAAVVLGATLTGQVTLTALDPDGDPLSYAWSSTCTGLTFDFSAPNSAAQPAFRLPGPSQSCAITVAVSDPPSRGGQTEGSLFLPPNQALASCSGVVCPVSDDCHLPGTCNPQSGTCSPQLPKPCPAGQTCDLADGICKPGDLCSGVVCQPSDACHLEGTCDPANGQCSAGAPKTCPAGQTCDLADGQCKPASSVTTVRPQVAKSLPLANLVGLGMDTAGATYVTGTLVPPPKSFDGAPLSSAGLGDVFVGSYDATGARRWVMSYGDPADQQPTSLTVADPASNRVLASGRFSGVLGVLNAGASTWDYLLFLDASTGAIASARSVNTGINGALLATGANPTLGLFAVCGLADQLARDTSAGGPGGTWATVAGANTFGGATDVLVALYSAGGTLLWAKQIGTTDDEECDAITVDDVGNVVAAGKYSGTSGALTFAGSTPLPSPGSSIRQHLWIAKFDGTTGAGLSQRSFGAGAGQHQVNGVAVDGSGNVFIAGVFTNRFPFSSTTGATACAAGSSGCLASSGGQDGFVAKLDPGLAPLWMTRVGVASGDDAIRGLALDSAGDPTVGGLLNGSSSAQTITPSTVATAAITSPSITSAGASASSYVMKLPASSGLFDPATARTTGNTFGSNTNRLVINSRGAGAAKDLVSFAGEYVGGTLDFGPPTTPITGSTGGQEDFLVFAKLLP